LAAVSEANTIKLFNEILADGQPTGTMLDQPVQNAGLIACDREPIHVPGSIQPHGMMLVADRSDLLVRHVAGDVEQRLGVVDWAGQALAALLGDTLTMQVAALLLPGASGGFIGQLHAPAGEVLDVSAHPSGAYVFVELEPASTDASPASSVLDKLETAAAGFEQALTLQALCDRAAVEFRRVTGFDRVMVYQFLDTDAGRVVAEDRQGGLRSFLNHHFPASDIPRQARALYVRNLTRAIPDVTYQPAPLRPGWTAAEPLDMSDSSLRSVFPGHLQYLKNMGVRSSASMSIVRDGVLWGLIACHNDTPRVMTSDVRMTCRALAGALARQVKAKEEVEGYRQRIRLRSFEDEIVRLLSREGSLEGALSKHLDEAGRMLSADGVAILRAGELVMNGVCPPEREIRDLAAWVLKRPAETIFSTDQLGKLYRPAQEYPELGSGLLALTVSVEEPWLLLWFRVDQAEVVNWAGNPHKTKGLDLTAELTPRASFDLWQETVLGRARRWTLPEIEAATRLRSALLDVRQTRQVHELNRRLTEILRDKDLLLEQQEFLIGEVNHRVKNSLQLVSSFLLLQARKSDSPEVHAALAEAQRRLTAVGLVHRRLFRGDQIQTINAARYIEELCADGIASMGQEWEKFLSLDLAPVTVSADQAITLGLILTELLININKHAYGGGAGPIEIRLIEERTNLKLIVADRGGGKVSSRTGFGTRVINALVTQLGGELIYEVNHPGVRAVLTAPIEIPKRAA